MKQKTILKHELKIAIIAQNRLLVNTDEELNDVYATSSDSEWLYHQ